MGIGGYRIGESYVLSLVCCIRNPDIANHECGGVILMPKAESGRGGRAQPLFQDV